MTDWTLTLGNKGFTGVTFARRPDVKLGLRPIPYFEIDADLELLKEIKNQFFKYGINSTITETKYFNSLHVTGVDNCIILSELLSLDDKWANSLRDDFQKGAHLTEKGIKKLFIEFGAKSLLTYDDVCEMIDAAKAHRLNEVVKKIVEGRKKLTLLPDYDSRYNYMEGLPCMRCRTKDNAKIYFTGKYPREGNIFLLCDECITAIR